MKSKQMMFFATISDFEAIMKSLEEQLSIKYYKTGLLDSDRVPTYDSIFEIPNLGHTKFGDWNSTDTFLILPINESLNVREVPQRIGGIKYAVDQKVNVDSIILNLGGIYDGAENVLIAGRVGTISEGSFAQNIYSIITKRIRKDFKKKESFYLGKDAEDKLKSGWRLVADVKFSKDYDLC